MLHCNIANQTVDKTIKTVGNYVIVTFPISRWNSISPINVLCRECNLFVGYLIPLKTCCHIHYHIYPFHFMLLIIWLLRNIQQFSVQCCIWTLAIWQSMKYTCRYDSNILLSCNLWVVGGNRKWFSYWYSSFSRHPLLWWLTDTPACGGHGSSYREFLFRNLLAVISVHTPCSDREIHQSSMDNPKASNTETSDQPILPSEENTSSEKQTQSAEKKTASARDDTASAVTKRWLF